jgi:hypothetical protein
VGIFSGTVSHILLFNQSSLTGGRYRFSVSFVECLLINGLQSPHKLLNEYIKALATCLPDDTGEPFTSDEPDLQISDEMGGFEWGRLQSSKFVLQLLILSFEIR